MAKLGFVLLLVFLSLVPVASQDISSQEETFLQNLEMLENKLLNIESQINDYQTLIQDYEKSEIETQRQLTSLREQLETLETNSNEERQRLRELIENLEERLADLRKQKEEAEKLLRESQADLRTQRQTSEELSSSLDSLEKSYGSTLMQRNIAFGVAGGLALTVAVLLLVR